MKTLAESGAKVSYCRNISHGHQENLVPFLSSGGDYGSAMAPSVRKINDDGNEKSASERDSEPRSYP